MKKRETRKEGRLRKRVSPSGETIGRGVTSVLSDSGPVFRQLFFIRKTAARAGGPGVGRTGARRCAARNGTIRP